MRTDLALLVVVAGLLTALGAVGPSHAADDPEVDGKVGIGALALGAFPSNAADARLSTDLRLDAANLGRKPIGIRLDGDFYFDADDVLMRTYRVQDLNLWLRPARGRVRLTLGRQRVSDHTEELVDGIGVRADLGRGFTLGGYGGLAPDPFTTLLSVKTGGGGLLFGYASHRFRAELASGLTGRSAGVDHSFVNAAVYATPAKALSLYGRAKLQGLSTSPGLAHAFTGITIRPARVFRIGLLYNAYSSEAYLDLVERDPALSRFAARADSLDLLSDVPNDQLDPAVYHQAGAHLDLRDGERHVAIGTRFRYRFVTEPDDRYLVAELHGGAIDLGKGLAAIRASGRYIRSSGRDTGQGEVGLETPVFKRRLDLAVYAMFSGSPAIDGEDRDTVGVYGDLFLSARLGKGWSLGTAVRVGWEDSPIASEATVDGLLKVTYRFRRVWNEPGATASASREARSW